MEDKPPFREFGRRVPAPLAPAARVKRSGHVALLLMGTFAVGGSAYALMPRQNCQPTPRPPGVAAPQGGSVQVGSVQAGANCNSRSYSSGSGHHSWRTSFYSSGDTSYGGSDSASHSVTRGGFGSFARSVAAHFSHGG
jgi:hypothetical protein